jgi:hypothetical protein
MMSMPSVDFLFVTFRVLLGRVSLEVAVVECQAGNGQVDVSGTAAPLS